jgi:hypothetical protein
MKTFILLTFGFLGFAFYQLSGGSDFESASARLAQTNPAPADPAIAQREITQAIVAAQVAPPAAEPVPSAVTAPAAKTDSVTRVSLDLTKVNAAAQTAPAQPVQSMATARIIDSTETPQIILPSLIATTNPATYAAADGDIRTVSGNRVNVRGGPSTTYGIVSTLTRGEAVRILEDDGDGWVRMQPIDGGEAGWIADFLLTSG